MIDQTKNIILSFTCDHAGRILSVIRDDVDLLTKMLSPTTIHDLVDEASVPKVWLFLEELNVAKAAADWTLNLSVNGDLQTLHFTGGVLEKQFLVVASNDQENIPLYFEELMQITNEHTNELRAAFKEKALLSRGEAIPGHLYQELMALNNELTNTQRELAKKNQELAFLNNEKNRFLGMAAHDLRTPLDVISGYSELLRDDSPSISPDERGAMLDSIGESVNYMLNLVNELLDYTKIESGTIRLNLQHASIGEVLKRALELVNPLALRKQIEIEIEMADALPEISIDVHRFSQVIVNLMTNAIKFSPPGSLVKIRVVQGDNIMRLEVIDSGQGIPAEELGGLFSPFSQTSVKPTGGEKSIGLGLLIVKRIVTAHHGQVSVKSQEGHGSTFAVELPLGRVGK